MMPVNTSEPTAGEMNTASHGSHRRAAYFPGNTGALVEAAGNMFAGAGVLVSCVRMDRYHFLKSIWYRVRYCHFLGYRYRYCAVIELTGKARDLREHRCFSLVSIFSDPSSVSPLGKFGIGFGPSLTSGRLSQILDLYHTCFIYLEHFHCDQTTKHTKSAKLPIEN